MIVVFFKVELNKNPRGQRVCDDMAHDRSHDPGRSF